MYKNKLYYSNYDVYTKVPRKAGSFRDSRFLKSKKKCHDGVNYNFIVNCFYKMKKEKIFYRSQVFQLKINPSQNNNPIVLL